MKELSIEQKAKAYDEAIKIAKSKIKNDKDHVLYEEDITDIFPELRESEDERIRKAIGYAIGQSTHSDGTLINGVSPEEALAWLEKQGEQNEIFNVPSREVILAIWDLGNEWKELTNCSISTEHGTQLDYIQKHWKESEYYLRAKQSEQKPTQEIEPTPIFRIGNILKRKGKDYTFRVDRIQGGYYHCDHNNGAFFPIEEQDKWELVEQKAWTEEDEKVIHCLEYTIKHFYEDEDTIKWCCDWLKSLRPQSHWKPSVEQMKALYDINLTGSISYAGQGQELINLYNDLKKLKG